MEALQHFSETMTAVGQALDQAVHDPAVQQAFGGLEKILAGQQASEAKLLAELCSDLEYERRLIWGWKAAHRCGQCGCHNTRQQRRGAP